MTLFFFYFKKARNYERCYYKINTTSGKIMRQISIIIIVLDELYNILGVK